ncbi:MAG: hypothetical protein WCO93_07285 [bacterium]
MPTSTSLKGLHTLKTIQTKKRDSENHKENSDYLKLFMLEKERTRLRNEQTRLTLRMENLNLRLKEIDDFYEATLGIKSKTSSGEIADQESAEEPKKEWKTISINY